MRLSCHVANTAVSTQYIFIKIGKYVLDTFISS